MVASIAAIRSRTYLTRQAVAEYHTQAGEPPGVWLGSGSADLGLYGKRIEEDVLLKVMDRVAPDGTPIGQKQKKKNCHQPYGWDITLSVPEGVAKVWAVAPPELREKIDRALDAAAEHVVAFLEGLVLTTRRGKGGAREEAARAIVGMWAHGSSRAGDPMPHRHLVVMAGCTRDDGTRGTV